MDGDIMAIDRARMREVMDGLNHCWKDGGCKKCPKHGECNGDLDVMLRAAAVMIESVLLAIEDGRMVELPCRPGDDIWWVDEEHEIPVIKREKGGVGGVLVRKNDFAIVGRDSVDMDGLADGIGGQYTCLSEADAAAVLKKMMARRK